MSLPDASEGHTDSEPTSSRSRSVSQTQSTKSTSDEEDKEFNKRLLVSLGMLLPALAAIIGVVAWAISAEVVMGAKREAARRHAEPMRLAHKFDYPRFHNVLPTKEMLVDPKSIDASRSLDNHEFFHKMEEFGQDLMMRKMDENKEDIEENNSKASAATRPSNAPSLLNDKLRDKLTQENIAQLIEKLLNSQSRNAKSPPIVLVTPFASHSKNASNSFIETKVTTTKPKSFNLKLASAKEEKTSTKAEKNTSSKKKSTPVASVKRKHSTSAHSKAPKTTTRPAVATTKSSTSKGKHNNFKTKIYEKEIDMLLQKIEKLEKQQNVKIEKGPIPSNVANSELLKGRPSDIADKIKGFLSGSHPSEASSDSAHSSESNMESNNDWQPSGPGMPPMPPPMPPMPFMPFMPPMHPSYGPPPPPPPNPEPAMSQDSNYAYAPPGEHYPKEGLQMEPSYQDYQQVAPPAQPQHHPTYEQHPEQYPEPIQPHMRPQHQQNAMSEMNSNQMNPTSSMRDQMAPSGQQYAPQQYESQMDETEPESNKKRKGFFGGKFKLPNIFNSVKPSKGKGRKIKQISPVEQPSPSDNRNIHIPNGSFDPMMAQESQMYQNVAQRQYPGEQPGYSVNYGAGPIGGGSQMKASPLGMIKSLMSPFRNPGWLNGKIIFGLVLENGIGNRKKPKHVFQHFSTGRLRR